MSELDDLNQIAMQRSQERKNKKNNKEEKKEKEKEEDPISICDVGSALIAAAIFSIEQDING